jgi:hypothetical protein
MKFDPRFGIEGNLFSLVKKHPQVQNGGLSWQCLFASAD